MRFTPFRAAAAAAALALAIAVAVSAGAKPEAAAVATAAQGAAPAAAASDTALVVYTDKVDKPDAEWKEILTPAQYRILRQARTEIAWTGPFVHNHAKGIYRCAACGQLLFSSDTKFESGTGWPSFWKPFSPRSLVTERDSSFGMERTEVLCSRCGSHLGHVFDDGPRPTGLRYCMNGLALRFVPTR